MVYVALLRGINVGGKNIVPMRALAETFRAQRLADVQTYIQSGNVLFRSKRVDPRRLERRLEAAVAEAHGCKVKVVVRSRDELRALVRALPPAWKRPRPTRRYYVIFLRHTVDSKAVLAGVEVNDEMEEIVYRRGALLWSATIAKITRSRVAKIIQRPLYADVTIRNLATTTKLCVLADAMAARAAPA